MRITWSSLFLALLVLVAGCTGKGATPDPAAEESPLAEGQEAVAVPAAPVESVEERVGHHIMEFDPLLFDATACSFGGGHSVYSYQATPIVEGFIRADAAERLGNPVIGTYGIPLVGGASGIFHATMRCDAWTYGGLERSGLMWGFIVMQVEPPAFDTGGADVHYLASQILVNDAELMDRVMMDSGIHVMPGEGVIEYDPGTGTLRTTYDGGEMHGLFESQLHVQPLRDVADETMRIWFLHYAADKTYHPISFDLHVTDAAHMVQSGGSLGLLSHTNTGDMHGPAPAAAGNVAGLFYHDAAATLSWGPRPNVQLAEAWEH